MQPAVGSNTAGFAVLIVPCHGGERKPEHTYENAEARNSKEGIPPGCSHQPHGNACTPETMHTSA